MTINSLIEEVKGITKKENLVDGEVSDSILNIIANSELSQLNRFEKIMILLDLSELTDEQKKSILFAHDVGSDREGSGVFNYNQEEILTKSRILKESGFDKDQIRILMENGIVGKGLLGDIISNVFGSNIEIEDIDNIILDIDKYKNTKKGKKILGEYPELLGDNFIDNILKKYPQLKLTNKITIGKNDFNFSNINISNSGYLEVLGSVNNGDGDKTRLFYKSYSDGGWRSSPGRRSMGGYSKGEGIRGNSYTVTTKVDDRLCKYLDSLIKIKGEGISLLKEFSLENLYKGVYFNELSKSTSNLDVLEKESTDMSDAIFDKRYDLKGVDKLNMYSGINLNNMESETKVFDDNGFLDVFREKGSPGYLKEDFSSVKEILEHINNLDHQYPEGFIPNFYLGPVSSRLINHTIAGKTKINIFEATLNGEKIEWHMANSLNESNRIWIHNIRLKNSKINSFGIDNQFINSGILNNKPFEYKKQIPNKYDNSRGTFTEKYLSEIGWKYFDITPLLSNLKPIKEYNKYLTAENNKEDKLKEFNNIIKSASVGDVLDIETTNSIYSFCKLENGKFNFELSSNKGVVKHFIGKEGNLYIDADSRISFEGLVSSGVNKISIINFVKDLDFSATTSLNEIFKIIEGLGELKTDNYTYSIKEMKNRIKYFLNNDTYLRGDSNIIANTDKLITRTGGLRAKLVELKKERQK